MDVIDLFQKIGKMKNIKRTGWVRAGIPNSESVADHAFRVAFMNMVLARKDLDHAKVLQMALLHEIGEAVVGDLVWERGGVVDPKAKEEKEKLENKAVEELLAGLDETKELHKLWEEYEKAESKEAKFVRQVDKLETALQASEYHDKYGVDTSEWLKSTKRHMKDKDFIELHDKISSKRI